MPESESKVLVRWDAFDEATTKRGWETDAERARQLGISQATLTNLRKGRVGVGGKVIAAVIEELGSFERFFERAA